MNRLPAEWAPQSALMLTWPHPGQDWAGDLANVEACFVEIALAASAYQPVIIGAPETDQAEALHARLTAAGAPDEHIRIYPGIPSDDVWARDHGPITVLRDGNPVLLDFRFDGWGGKYPAGDDDRITARLHSAGAFGGLEIQTVDLILEGGSIESDGDGGLLTTASCLLESARNPDTGREAYEALFRRAFGADRVLWLEHGALVGDDTDGHVDTLVRFAAADTLVYQGCTDERDVHYPALSAMAEELRRMRTRRGDPYKLIELPLPRPLHAPDGRRLPAGYANFAIINGAVLMPTYADPADETARELLQAVFPTRRMIPIDCRALVRQNGSLHCVTMHLPTQSP